METRISLLIIALLTVGIVMAIFSGFIYDVGQKYGKDDSTLNLSVYDKTAEINADTLSVKAKVENITSKPDNVFDIIGNFFSGGVQAAKVTYNSVDLVNDMNDKAIDSLPLGSSGVKIKNYITALIFVVVFIMIVLSLILKWNM